MWWCVRRNCSRKTFRSIVELTWRILYIAKSVKERTCFEIKLKREKKKTHDELTLLKNNQCQCLIQSNREKHWLDVDWLRIQEFVSTNVRDRWNIENWTHTMLNELKIDYKFKYQQFVRSRNFAMRTFSSCNATLMNLFSQSHVSNTKRNDLQWWLKWWLMWWLMWWWF